MKFQILGSLQAEVDGNPVDLGPPKQRALLAILIINANQVVPTERIIELMWGEKAPRTASHSVQLYISMLRKSLSDAAIETRPPGYILHADPADIDVVRFQRLIEGGGPDRLREALAIWGDAPLSDFVYEGWAQPHVRRLEGLHARAVELLATAELEDGRPGEVPGLVDLLIEKEPLREEPRRLLMLALYRTGRQAEALRVFRDFRRLLAEEVGVEPSTGLAQLEEQILLQDPVLTPPRADRGPAVVQVRNPYKGLGAFDEIDAADFFGRDKLVSEMTDALEGGDRLLVVVGPSGSGKSSTVRAGLIPALRRGAVAGSDRWVLTTMMPGAHPFEQLEAALTRVAPSEVPLVRQQLTEDDTGLLRVALRILRDERSELLLVVDQFEEIFTLSTERMRRRFLDGLVTAVTDVRSRIRVVLALRADFYDRPLLSSRFAPVFASGVVNVVPLAPAELEAAVVEPAAGVGVRVEPALLAELVAAMGEETVALPLLQYTLTELFNTRTGQALTLNDYGRLGGLEGALADRADQVFGHFDPASQEVAKRLLLHLVSLERGSGATRRRVPLDELRTLGEVEEVLASFISHRLLTADRDPLTAEATVQVTHEALLEAWGRLREWIEVHNTDLQRRSVLTTAAGEWEAARRDSDYLLAGSRLAHMETWSRETTLGIATIDREYLDASLQQRRIVEGPPLVALLMESGSYGFNEYISEGYERAVESLDARTQRIQFGPLTFGDEIRKLADAGAPYIVVATSEFEEAVVSVAADHPNTRFGILDGAVEDAPNVASIRFADQEGSFLVGAAAALKSQTGKIGFVGGVDIPVVHRCEAGFEAGARAVDPDIKISAKYLTPRYDLSGFASFTLGRQAATLMFRDGVDAVFTAAGVSDMGTFQAAAELTPEAGRQLWAIGVDTDEYYTSEVFAVREVIDPSQWKPHILTSMLKRVDVAIFTMMEEFAGGGFTKTRVLGLAEDGVGYSTSGGFIEDIVPVLEDLKAKIISGEIVVPALPEACTADSCARYRAGDG